MTAIGWAQIALILGLVTATAIPLGRYTAAVAEGRVTFLAPLERLFYRAGGIDPALGMGWRAYTLAMLGSNLAGFLLLFAILRFQGVLPLNPENMSGMNSWLAFNTAVSFVSNTNWQAYSGESGLSYLSQMVGLTVQNFLSASTGIALALALSRAFAASGVKNLGNYWTDFVRVTLYLLLPLAIVLGLLLVAGGVPQSLSPYVQATTLDGGTQTIPLGPAAFQIAIKQLGTNGGGFFGVNSAHPFENPTPWTNLLECWAILAIPFALALTFGRIVRDIRQGWALFAVMMLFVVAGVAITYGAEAGGNPLHIAAGVDPTQGNMEGKEVRFGTALSALWAVATTGASNGSVRCV